MSLYNRVMRAQSFFFFAALKVTIYYNSFLSITSVLHSKTSGPYWKLREACRRRPHVQPPAI